jgi:branched-chain amino acid transport system substrate-binding protein
MKSLRIKPRMTSTTVCLFLSCIALANAQDGLKELKVGIITSKTGTLAFPGAEGERGIRFAGEEINGKGGVGGFKVVFATQDDEGTPEGARRGGEKLTLDGYKILAGPVTSSNTIVLSTQLERWGAMLIGTLGQSDKLIGDSCTRRMFHTTNTDSINMSSMTPWLQGRSEAEIAFVGLDYAWGHDVGLALEKTAARLGKKVVSSEFPPLGTKDFAPYIQKLQASPAKLVVTALLSQEMINFIQQANSFGLAKDKTITGIAMLQKQYIDATGTMMTGLSGDIDYSPLIETKENKKFVSAWTTKYNQLPSRNEAEGYIMMQALFAAVGKTKSSDPVEISKALEGEEIPTIIGTFKMRAADHQLLRAKWFGTIGVKDGVLQPIPTQDFAPAAVEVQVSPDCRMVRW